MVLSIKTFFVADDRPQEFYARTYSDGLNSLIRKGAWPGNDFRLSVPGYIAVARKRRQTEPRTPRETCRFGPETRQGFPGLCGLNRAGRSREGVLENRPDRPSATPVLAVDSRCLEMPTVANHNLRCGE